jgi:integrase
MRVRVDYLIPDKKSGRLIYRRRFPQELIPYIPSRDPRARGRSEFKASLHATSLNAPGAMERYKAIEFEYEDIVAKARKRAAGQFDDLDARTIAIIAAGVVHDGLTVDDEVRLTPAPVERKRERATIMAQTSEADLAECRELRAIGDVERMIELWGDEAASIAEFEGLHVDRSAPSFAALCSAINDAQIATWEATLARLKGDLVPTPPLEELPASKKQRSLPGGPISLMELFDRYAKQPGIHPKTIAQWRPYFVQLEKFTRKSDARTVTHDDLVAWRDHLQNDVTYRGKPLSAKTINGSYLGASSAVFRFAKGNGIIPANPMLEVAKVRQEAKPQLRSKGFTPEEARTILTAALAVGKTDDEGDFANTKRWCPWLMAYSGARVNEITQLRQEDIFERDGVHVMRITPEAGTVKTRMFRLVPLHRHLVEQGFLEFAKNRSKGPLFFDPSRRRSENAINRQASRQGSRLAEWVRSLGIDGVKPNHAWRHFFSANAVRHGLDPRITKAITGHSTSDVHDKVYLEGLPDFVDVLFREIEKIPRFTTHQAAD